MKGFVFFRDTHPEAENDIFAARTETLQDAEVSTIARRSKTRPYVGGWFVEQADLKYGMHLLDNSFVRINVDKCQDLWQNRHS